MGKKIIKSTLFATIVMAVVCAGTLSARQLRNHSAASPFCGGICGKHISCSIDCFCNIPAGTKTGSCILPPAFKPAK